MAMRTLSSSTIGIAIVAFWLMGCGLTAAVGAPGHYPNNSGPIILSNMNGMQAYILPIGATIQRLIVPDQRGMAEDIVLGFDDATQYQTNNTQYFGGIVGRVANRIANASFSLDNHTYNLGANDRGNTLHGGFNPLFENSTWDVLEADSTHVKLRFISPDGAQGFPGALQVTATYVLTNDNQLQLDIEATASKATPVNLAQHTYFNLNGEASPLNVLNHELYINGDYYTPVDFTQIPTGQLLPVYGTAFDFTKPRTIGSRINEVTYPPPHVGYDHNWALFGLGMDAANKTHIGAVSNEAQLAVTLHSPASGRYMDLYTNMPGLQFYSGNNLNGSTVGKGAYPYPVYGGMALETQVWPNYLHEAQFPQSVLRPNEAYHHKWYLRFYTKPAAAAPALGPSSVAVKNAASVKPAPAPGL
ncbi:hypothetical protein CVIRNUC_009594 [Coccomyxa viridis]|uniref:Aldose 1-epimerase n=1 Tax=Coccomyxa viridis TaxID=1274662 RepID=A0AAV1IIA9_9CHLO|nr:hypothetical protein CVIRNUC_009594 [Coccomyxa viridis]